MTHHLCPICHAQASPLTGVTYHHAHCPNGVAQALAWGPGSVTPEDARTWHREAVGA